MAPQGRPRAVCRRAPPRPPCVAVHEQLSQCSSPWPIGNRDVIELSSSTMSSKNTMYAICCAVRAPRDGPALEGCPFLTFSRVRV